NPHSFGRAASPPPAVRRLGKPAGDAFDGRVPGRAAAHPRACRRATHGARTGERHGGVGLTYWPFFCRTVYGEVRRLRSALFIEAQRGLGASTSRILFVHVLPNVASAVIVGATIGMGFTIMPTAVLGFLGIGATPPNPDWGLAIAEGREYLPQSWW